MIRTAIIFTKDTIKFTEIIGKIFKTRFSRSLHIKNIINHEKLLRLTKLQIANINTYFRRNELYIRVAVKGHKVWEVWYQ